MNTSLPQNGELNYKPDSTVFSEPRYSTASTQTPPEFAPSEDEPQPGMLNKFVFLNCQPTRVGWSAVNSLRPILCCIISSVPVRLYGGEWWADIPFPWPVRRKHGPTWPVVLHQRICERYGTWRQGTGTNLSLFWLASRYLSSAFLFLFGFSPLLAFLSCFV